jgi:hypothetical protein
MEITNEVKAKVFAQYLGQKCVADNGECGELCGVSTSFFSVYIPPMGEVESDEIESSISGTTFRLRPLSAITDEDAIQCYSLTDPRYGKPAEIEYYTHRHKPKNQLVSIDVRRVDIPNECLNIGTDGKSFIRYDDRTEPPKIERIENQYAVYQFLQSRGYDLPHYLLGGKTLHECGLAIYETK